MFFKSPLEAKLLANGLQQYSSTFPKGSRAIHLSHSKIVSKTQPYPFNIKIYFLKIFKTRKSLKKIFSCILCFNLDDMWITSQLYLDLYVLLVIVQYFYCFLIVGVQLAHHLSLEWNFVIIFFFSLFYRAFFHRRHRALLSLSARCVLMYVLSMSILFVMLFVATHSLDAYTICVSHT